MSRFPTSRLPLALITIAWVLGLSGPALARAPGGAPPSWPLGPQGLYATREPNLFAHNAGLLTLQITNIGMIGNIFVDDLSAGWRSGEYLFLSGLWVGAIGADSEPHVSGTYFQGNSIIWEFLPDRDARWHIYESYESVNGGTRLGLLGPAAADDDQDGEIDEDFQNGLDDDLDGKVDEDFEAIGQQMFSCMYRDDTPEAIAQYADHVPLNLLVRQRSFQWSSEGSNEFVGFEFEVVNTGDQRLKELYIGFFSDTDAGPKTAPGYWTDDFVGWATIDTTVVDADRSPGCQSIELRMDAAFMWDVPDNGTSILGGDVPGVFGSLFLGHTTDDTGIRAPQNVGLTTVAWFSAGGQDTDPQSDAERYQLLSSATKPQRGASRADDYRYVVAAGPFFQLNPGESLVFQTAYVIGEGHAGFRGNAVNAQRVFNGQFLNADDNPATGVEGKERCLQALEVGTEVVWDDPCDTLEVSVSFRRTPPCTEAGEHYVNADCDPCTGVEGKETLVNWVGATAPPSPVLNTNPELRERVGQPGFTGYADPAGDRKVVLEWDNASELSVDPLSGDRLFRGYRIWRADNWQRPSGSIGPTQADWMKIAEFRTDAGSANSYGAVPLDLPFPEGAVVRTVKSIGTARDGTPIYPVGRYRYEDTSGILNGKLYFYAVSAFGIDGAGTELGGLPTAIEAEAVVPRWDASAGCDRVSVVPNPYRGGADWDLLPNERDPTGTRIAFRSLPEEVSTIHIYTLSGDLVKESEHDGRSGDGTYFWDLISRNGQNVTSGIYLYSVTYSGGTCRGRFVIIR